ncbi:MAG: hypothetical protein Q9226_005846 [Calogaya cf. arnoldii]
MPKAKALATKDDNARVSPYSKSKSSKTSTTKSTTDKENADAKPTSKPKLSKAAAEIQAQYSDFRDIPLDEFDGEVPCYDDASVVRRKLNKLLTDKLNIPGTNKKWTQAGMSKEMEELESRMGVVECHRNSTGPSTRSLATFLKKKGKMGGGDSPAYYWGYVLLEKLRIWEGAKKSKPREEAEKDVDFLEVLFAKIPKISAPGAPSSLLREDLLLTGSLMGGTVLTTAYSTLARGEQKSSDTKPLMRRQGVRFGWPSRFPGGRVREDPDHCFILAEAGNVPPWEPEARKDKKERMQNLHEKLEEIRAAKKE